jgi:ribonucleoside-diphosphate reductase alpha chain
MTRFAAPIAEQIWDMKYRLKSAEGKALDETVEDTWRRIATDLASVEADPKGTGRGRSTRRWRISATCPRAASWRARARAAVTLFNCFVMGTIPDSMAGIFEALKEAALTMQQGGGIGYDFSTIRPKGAPVSGVAADASGPLSFMDVWDAMCRTIMSAGLAPRRDDGDDALRPSRYRGFHRRQGRPEPPAHVQRVGAGDRRLHGGGEGGRPVGADLRRQVYKTLRARDLWNRIMRATYDYAEPGVIFIDRINPRTTSLRETIAATNPCGEQPLPPYGACLLGSVNLARLVAEPFEDGADWTRTRWPISSPPRSA